MTDRVRPWINTALLAAIAVLLAVSIVRSPPTDPSARENALWRVEQAVVSLEGQIDSLMIGTLTDPERTTLRTLRNALRDVEAAVDRLRPLLSEICYRTSDGAGFGCQ